MSFDIEFKSYNNINFPYSVTAHTTYEEVFINGQKIVVPVTHWECTLKEEQKENKDD